jgi:hypothetical protein
MTVHTERRGKGGINNILLRRLDSTVRRIVIEEDLFESASPSYPEHILL